MFDILRKKYPNKTKTSGFTMVELIVTIALFAIVSLLITSMTMYINKFTNNRKQLIELNEEVSACESTVKSWFNNYDDAFSTIVEVSSDDENGYYVNIDDLHFLCFEDGSLKIKEGDSVVSSYSYDHVIGLTFDHDSTLGLINCHIISRGEKKEYVYDVLLYKKV